MISSPQASPEAASSRPDTAGIAAKLAMRILLWLGAFALLLFVPAGTLDWPGAWIFLAIMSVTSFLSTLWLARHDPALLKERLRPPFQREQPLWDKTLMAHFMPLWLGWYVVMGFDRRFAWSAVPVAAQALGALLLALAMTLVWLTLRENSYAATAVKIQRERGHTVVSTGPYAYVRHPMYAGAILFSVGLPLLLGSWWGLALSPLLVLIFGLRAVKEEEMLRAGLDGYAGYTACVRYRFVPLIW
jgi:protein-S-isoprenylcysteine O-methyltransferase Ste14